MAFVIKGEEKKNIEFSLEPFQNYEGHKGVALDCSY